MSGSSSRADEARGPALTGRIRDHGQHDAARRDRRRRLTSRYRRQISRRRHQRIRRQPPPSPYLDAGGSVPQAYLAPPRQGQPHYGTPTGYRPGPRSFGPASSRRASRATDTQATETRATETGATGARPRAGCPRGAITPRSGDRGALGTPGRLHPRLDHHLLPSRSWRSSPRWSRSGANCRPSQTRYPDISLARRRRPP